jgi:hypothetical protein
MTSPFPFHSLPVFTVSNSQLRRWLWQVSHLLTRVANWAMFQQANLLFTNSRHLHCSTVQLPKGITSYLLILDPHSGDPLFNLASVILLSCRLALLGSSFDPSILLHPSNSYSCPPPARGFDGATAVKPHRHLAARRRFLAAPRKLL